MTSTQLNSTLLKIIASRCHQAITRQILTGIINIPRRLVASKKWTSKRHVAHRLYQKLQLIDWSETAAYAPARRSSASVNASAMIICDQTPRVSYSRNNYRHVAQTHGRASIIIQPWPFTGTLKTSITGDELHVAKCNGSILKRQYACHKR